LINNEISSVSLEESISMIEAQVRGNRSGLSRLIERLARTNMPPVNTASLHTLSATELERAFEISTKVFPKNPLTQEEKDRAREKLRTVLSQIEARFRPPQ
jgi:hypothetical protein